MTQNVHGHITQTKKPHLPDYTEDVASDGGAKGSRTPDLLNAIQALYQLSYGPGIEQQFTTRLRRCQFRATQRRDFHRLFIRSFHMAEIGANPALPYHFGLRLSRHSAMMRGTHQSD